jgi:hypothetical protein
VRLEKLIVELVSVLGRHGNIEVYMQNNPKKPDERVEGDANIFVVPEKYEEDNEPVVNLRTWPY